MYKYMYIYTRSFACFCSAFLGEDWLGDQHCGHELGHPKKKSEKRMGGVGGFNFSKK